MSRAMAMSQAMMMTDDNTSHFTLDGLMVFGLAAVGLGAIAVAAVRCVQRKSKEVF